MGDVEYEDLDDVADIIHKAVDDAIGIAISNSILAKLEQEKRHDRARS